MLLDEKRGFAVRIELNEIASSAAAVVSHRKLNKNIEQILLDYEARY